jgi:hypothetical protein
MGRCIGHIRQNHVQRRMHRTEAYGRDRETGQIRWYWQRQRNWHSQRQWGRHRAMKDR